MPIARQSVEQRTREILEARSRVPLEKIALPPIPERGQILEMVREAVDRKQIPTFVLKDIIGVPASTALVPMVTHLAKRANLPLPFLRQSINPVHLLQDSRRLIVPDYNMSYVSPKPEQVNLTPHLQQATEWAIGSRIQEIAKHQQQQIAQAKQAHLPLPKFDTPDMIKEKTSRETKQRIHQLIPHPVDIHQTYRTATGQFKATVVLPPDKIDPLYCQWTLSDKAVIGPNARLGMGFVQAMCSIVSNLGDASVRAVKFVEIAESMLLGSVIASGETSLASISLADLLLANDVAYNHRVIRGFNPTEMG